MERAGRTVVLLKRQVIWDRLDLLNRSQGWLAREIGVSPSYLARLLRKGRAPSGRIRRRLQRILGFDGFDDLFELERPV